MTYAEKLKQNRIDKQIRELEKLKQSVGSRKKKSLPVNYQAGGDAIPAQTSLGLTGSRSSLAGQIPNIPFPDSEGYAPYWTRPYLTGSRQEIWKGFIDEGMHIQNPRLREIHRMQMAEKRAREAAGIYPPVIPSGPNPWDAIYRG